MSDDFTARLARDYIEYGRTKDKTYEYAYEHVSSHLHIELVILLVEACETDKDIAWVAAGPLEDIMREQPDPIKEALDMATGKSSKMRKALEGVWLTPDTKAHDLLSHLLKKYNLHEGAL